MLPGRTRARPAPRRRAEPCPHILVASEPRERLREGLDVARLDEEAFPLVSGEIGEVARPPPDDGETECHRLAPHGPIRLSERGQDEDVGRAIERRDFLGREATVNHDAAREVGLCEARPDLGRVARIGGVVAREVERG